MFAPAEVKAGTPLRSGGDEGCLRAASAERVGDVRTKREDSSGCLHLRLCFFLTKVARIHIRYKKKKKNR